ncbi:unnamed protein product (macronuclear) [Paramecium tetraurelia]|uniref:FUZ/MON1/HPS1 first Longin domain-containing protein n=1 Tax=Paramecium tetraurelia TaxID=5888 RepID=A0DT76_PARTE|nr:uncharacterized protein GSPATT00019936001 [Paramecium tetraurelia]CAK86243.1 unnamed protein product [Paramecium tetraurelia]|eukprot:XP_001453640.1 hypothetical protein (macronuclear) [Paramecium tetraurelia strain d4-2]
MSTDPYQYKSHVINVSYSEISPDIPEFFTHKRHVFIMTNTGRPIYVRYGNEIKSSIFLATINAIFQKFLLFFFEDKEKQTLFRISHDKCNIYILQRNQITYICTTNSLQDSEFIIYQMLDFLNTQLISIVTDQANVHLTQKPNYDLAFSVGGSRNLLTLAVKNGLYSPCIAFNSICTLPMAVSLRQFIHNNLKEIKLPNIIASLLLTETFVIDIWRQKNMEFKTSDILIIQSMIQGQGQLKKGENWIPICLPGLSAMGFVYAYINFFEKPIGIVMISDDNSLDMFEQCKEAAQVLIQKFNSNNLQQTLLSNLQNNPNTPKCLDKYTQIKHFIVKHNSGQVYLPVFQAFGVNNKTFKFYMQQYGELYKDFMISQSLGNSDAKQNYFVWDSKGFGITQYHDVVILFCFNELIEFQQMVQNVHILQRMFRTEELGYYFVLKQS